ncbi:MULTISPECIES: hypothetical protein [unclassified Granulicatella]|uniref:hypothetical protein n=1 Tax=unclassified Granulicatella TaxID=2630493 RepID=UPI001073CBD2|nr:MULTISPECIES: hypothetical protein [unclassified Granulicatella]MBF0780674.1 hypothetical protein [Granulicatella sp. 19428wC4_WM01]TFU94251.1 hypothetical protein E4T68_06150 [Granulicatella sp. WM01]
MNILGQLKKVASELSEVLTSYRFDEAYALAGQLNALLKSEEAMKLARYEVEVFQECLRGYYSANEQRNAAQKRMVAIGHHLGDVK